MGATILSGSGLIQVAVRIAKRRAEADWVMWIPSSALCGSWVSSPWGVPWTAAIGGWFVEVDECSVEGSQKWVGHESSDELGEHQ